MSRDHEESDELRGRLGALRVPPADGDFPARLHLRLASAGVPPTPGLGARLRELVERFRFLAWPAGGVLAGVLTFALLSALRGPGPGGAVPVASAPGGQAPVARGEVTPTFVVPSAKVAVIKLAFAAEVDVDDVMFEVSLPEGLAFWSRGHSLPGRSYRWPGRLSAGENVFPVAVRGERPGVYRVKARARMGAETVEHEIVLDVKGKAG
jgi:hypothetical protein